MSQRVIFLVALTVIAAFVAIPIVQRNELDEFKELYIYVGLLLLILTGVNLRENAHKLDHTDKLIGVTAVVSCLTLIGVGVYLILK